MPAGTGWPDDPASPDTPVARDADDVRRLARDRCPARGGRARQRLRGLPEVGDVARGRGPGEAGVVRRPALLGQADRRVGEPPSRRCSSWACLSAANGGNRTGRIFTGDPSADWLFASLHRTGWAAHPPASTRGTANDCWGARMVATVRCAPPDNKPTPAERDTCAPWIAEEISLLLPTVRAVVALGSFGWDGVLRSLAAAGLATPPRKPTFAHGAEVALAGERGGLTLIGCYHPSPHNTYTRRLTPEMTDEVFTRARTLTK